jgi:hypothetical protein
MCVCARVIMRQWTTWFGTVKDSGWKDIVSLMRLPRWMWVLGSPFVICVHWRSGVPWSVAWTSLKVWDKALMIQPFSCFWRAGNVFTWTLNGFGQWSNKILLLRKKNYSFLSVVSSGCEALLVWRQLKMALTVTSYCHTICWINSNCMFGSLFCFFIYFFFLVSPVFVGCRFLQLFSLFIFIILFIIFFLFLS